jgi:hypothetical protein
MLSALAYRISQKYTACSKQISGNDFHYWENPSPSYHEENFDSDLETELEERF